MQFKHPEILYALFLLIIPIIVHLFQLQKFVKVPFTNVEFLKNIEQQTRKSAQLKKWLILLTRLLAFTSLIIAFSQPFFSKVSTQQNFKTTIYLDNSFSMQAKGENGKLLKILAQQIIKNSNGSTEQVSLLTNNNYYKNLTALNLKNKLLNIEYYPIKLDLSTILFQLNSHNSTKINTSNKNIILSDFQTINITNKPNFTNVNATIELLKVAPKTQHNVYIDSVYLDSKNPTEIRLNIQVKSTKKGDLTIPISLYNNSKLIGKTTAKFNDSKSQIVQFTIQNTENFNGKISLVDANLTFDNDFYFCISEPSTIAVLSIGKNSAFLAKIYTKKEFNFTATPLQNLNYNNIQNQQLIILNEIENIPSELILALTKFTNNGGSLVIIPSEKIDIETYNNLFNILKIGRVDSKIEGEHKITTINYEHPLIKNVFEKKVHNFQYPSTTIYYKTYFKTQLPVLKFDNNQTFVSSINLGKSRIYWISSPLNKEISNFTQSPLVVPIFYNFAKNNLSNSELYYIISPNTKIEVLTSIGKDEVLKISNETTQFIPLQTIAQNKVLLHLKNNILKSGFYQIKTNNKTIKTIAFNYDRSESDLTYTDLKSLISTSENATISSSINAVFNEINNQQKINWLFKWFLAFSVLFLFIEMLILKYFNI